MKKKELRKDSLETLMFGGCVEEVYSKETYKESRQEMETEQLQRAWWSKCSKGKTAVFKLHEVWKGFTTFDN